MFILEPFGIPKGYLNKFMLSKLIGKVREEKKAHVEKKPDDTQRDQQNLQLEQQYLTKRRYEQIALNSVFYIPEYITPEDEEYLKEKIYLEPMEKWEILHHSNRRLQKWGGDVTSSGLKNKETLPIWLDKIGDMLQKENITEKRINHVLLNEYQPGVGIMPHTDGPAYYPFVVILSLGSTCLFEFFANYAGYKDKEYIATLLIEPRSLLIFTGEAYSKYLHCIEDNKVDFIQTNYKILDTGEPKITHKNIHNLELTNHFSNFRDKIKKDIDKEKEKGVEYKVVEDLKRSMFVRLENNDEIETYPKAW